MRHAQVLWLTVLATAGVSGCATIIHGTTETVRFESAPPAATVHVDDQTLTTPAQANLARGKAHDVTFEKLGYVSAHDHIGQASSGAVFGNLILGGLIGMVVDFSDGAAYNLEPATLSETLVPDPSAAPGAQASAHHVAVAPVPAHGAAGSAPPSAK